MSLDNYLTGRAMAPLLGYLRGLGVAPSASLRVATGAVEVLLVDYRDYLAVERGLTKDTIEGYVSAVRPFLDGRLSDEDELDLGGLSVGRRGVRGRAVSGAVAWGGEDDGGALRSLLGFLYLRGLVVARLAEAVPSTASWRLAGLPRALDRSSSTRCWLRVTEAP